MANQMSMTICLKHFFGYLPGQSLKEFSAECSRLSEEEKQSLAFAAKAEMIRTGQNTPEDFAF